MQIDDHVQRLWCESTMVTKLLLVNLAQLISFAVWDFFPFDLFLVLFDE